MDDDNAITESEVPPGIGDRLRIARETRGLTIEQVAAETRIPQRHLRAIEAGDFSKLPGRTYAVGFSRTFAKAVGLDQDEIGAIVRADLDAQNDDEYRPASFEPGDPARVPSRALGWFAAFAVLLLLAGMYFFFRTMFAPAGELPSLLDREKPQVTAPGGHSAATVPASAPDPSGAVVFTAQQQGVWVKFYDASGKQLMQKQMDLGESYTVPADATGPQLWTGRPDQLAITIGGKPVPKLAEEQRTMKDVPVTAAALLARAAQPAPEPSATAVPRRVPVRPAAPGAAPTSAATATQSPPPEPSPTT